MIKQVIDLFFSLIVFTGSIYLWGVADRFPIFEKYKNVDSDFWPKIILTIIGILAIIIFYQNIRTLRIQIRKRDEIRPKSQSSPASSRINQSKMILMGGLCIAYYWGLSLMGFIIATILFMWLAMVVIGGTKKATLILFPILFTGVLAGLFIKGLELSLPRGVGLFYQFSLLLY